VLRGLACAQIMRFCALFWERAALSVNGIWNLTQPAAAIHRAPLPDSGLAQASWR
jgi:hypothetical protein